eukprot:CAMPEP_0197693410 /NCGR_PEP_ID=MMETSP1338-20131121/112462_1 /TAXON_ID=43686 ORGANISM="Pelagodinium beii, Strain RCC1491" /NCGR_SAMPLE_ID=MMETSP1338 /ASSEMBLY_ACC=CAM_ASM_000754 /LENGTH=69 /DNA_ID=CAMNT_0043276153 /DNA_START=42 /DNA_END=248 /DNA_ORIENTATION=-
MFWLVRVCARRIAAGLCVCADDASSIEFLLPARGALVHVTGLELCKNLQHLQPSVQLRLLLWMNLAAQQ